MGAVIIIESIYYSFASAGGFFNCLQLILLLAFIHVSIIQFEKCKEINFLDILLMIFALSILLTMIGVFFGFIEYHGRIGLPCSHKGDLFGYWILGTIIGPLLFASVLWIFEIIILVLLFILRKNRLNGSI